MRICIFENNICTNAVEAATMNDILFLPGTHIESNIAEKGWVLVNNIPRNPDLLTPTELDSLTCPKCDGDLDETGKCSICGYQL